MKEAILKHKGLVIAFVVLVLVGTLSFNALTCFEGSAMVVNVMPRPNQCGCKGWRITLYDDRPVDGGAKYLCLGIPE